MGAICEIFRCVDTPKSAMVFVAGNVLIFSLFSVTFTDLMICYLPVLLLAAGGVAKFMMGPKKVKELPQQLSADCMECARNYMNMALARAAPIVFWENVTDSAIVLAAWYVASTIICYTGLFALVFLAFNGAFVFGNFEKEIKTMAGPHMEKAKAVGMEKFQVVKAIAMEKLQVVMAMIPKHEEEKKTVAEADKSE